MPRGVKKHRTSLEEAKQTLAKVEEALSEAERNGLEPEKRTALLRERRQAANVVARLSGEGIRVNMRTLLNSADWRRTEKALVEALRPFPEASKAVEKVLRELNALQT